MLPLGRSPKDISRPLDRVTMGVKAAKFCDGFTHASIVRAVRKSRLGDIGAVTTPSTPSNWNACPTLPATNVVPIPAVPLFPARISVAFPSAGHQLTSPPGSGVHLHVPAVPAAKMFW